MFHGCPTLMPPAGIQGILGFGSHSFNSRIHIAVFGTLRLSCSLFISCMTKIYISVTICNRVNQYHSYYLINKFNQRKLYHNHVAPTDAVMSFESRFAFTSVRIASIRTRAPVHTRTRAACYKHPIHHYSSCQHLPSKPRFLESSVIQKVAEQ